MEKKISWDEDANIAYTITVYVLDADHFHDNQQERKLMDTFALLKSQIEA